jgi:hypothetical protein
MTTKGESMKDTQHNGIRELWEMGYEVQYRAPNGSIWVDCPDPAWIHDYEYRIRPSRLAQPPTRREWLFTVGALVIVLMVSFVLSGCEKSPDGNQSSFAPGGTPVAIYVDRGTGCEYASADSGHSAITPRIAADGKTHMGCREVRN